MIQVYWLEQAQGDVPAETGWLTPRESAHLESLRVPKRRADWLLGRWTAKKAVAIHLNLPLDPHSLADIEVLAASSGAPEVLVANQPASVGISLSHRGGRAICAIAPSGEALGCDLEFVEPRTDAFVADYLAPEEQTLVTQASEADRPRIVALLWSAKESALKALREGLRLDTRCVLVSLAPQGDPAEGSPVKDGTWHAGDKPSDVTACWRELRVRHGESQVFHGWWSQSAGFLRTAVTIAPSGAPILLRASTGLDSAWSSVPPMRRLL
jgi:4'-phosphopantetheinyl transferase